jgi:hypothetical protein
MTTRRPPQPGRGWVDRRARLIALTVRPQCQLCPSAGPAVLG